MGHVYNQIKLQIIGILEEKDSFYWSKIHLWKRDKKIGQGPPPLFGQNPKEQQHLWDVFFKIIKYNFGFNDFNFHE